MSADFNWWLLVVGVAVGVGLTWLVMADTTRYDREISGEETAAEAGWIAHAVENPLVDVEVAEEVLQAHRRYLGFPPPDALVTPDELRAAETGTHELSMDPAVPETADEA